MTPKQESSDSTSRRWQPKTPGQIVLQQIGKQQKKVESLKEELKREERELVKLEQAKKIFEGAS